MIGHHTDLVPFLQQETRTKATVYYSGARRQQRDNGNRFQRGAVPVFFRPHLSTK